VTDDEPRPVRRVLGVAALTVLVIVSAAVTYVLLVVVGR